MLPVGYRRGEGVPQAGEEFLVGSLCHAVRLEPPTSILGAGAPRRGGSVGYGAIASHDARVVAQPPAAQRRPAMNATDRIDLVAACVYIALR